MLPFHDEPVICENIIAKILFASCSVKISYRKNFRVYGTSTAKTCCQSVKTPGLISEGRLLIEMKMPQGCQKYLKKWEM